MSVKQVTGDIYASMQQEDSITDLPAGFQGQGQSTAQVTSQCTGQPPQVVYMWTSPFAFGVAYTKSKWNGTDVQNPDGSVTCDVNDWCTAQTSPPKCSPTTIVQAPLIVGMNAQCYDYYNTTWLWEALKGVAATCYPLIPAQNAVGTTDPSLYACTK